MLAIDASPRRAVKAPKAPKLGHARPRLAPPIPARSEGPEFSATAADMGITLMPWQETAARYLTAKGPDGRLLYREVAIVVARQNGKTTLMKPHIVRSLRAGKRILHLAQNRELPRHMFGLIADALSAEEDLFPKRRGRTIWPRYGSGQEEIALENGGWYRIAASSHGSGRGWAADIVIIDELREADDPGVIGMVEPTLMMSSDPQLIELSNAGHSESIVLNAVRERADKDESLAYLEWSASPERDPGDVAGWAEANPALGHYPSVMRGLEAAYRKHRLSGTMATFETEHLCRWVVTMQPRLVAEAVWLGARGVLEARPVRPMMGVSMDASGRRASAVTASQQSDGTIGLRVIADVTGEPIDVDALGAPMRELAIRLGVPTVGFDPLTDTALARHFKDSKGIAGQDFANACATFVRLLDGGKLHWENADQITDDLSWAARRPYEGLSGAWKAVKTREDRPVTALFAAIRAVDLASGHKPSAPKVF